MTDIPAPSPAKLTADMDAADELSKRILDYPREWLQKMYNSEKPWEREWNAAIDNLALAYREQERARIALVQERDELRVKYNNEVLVGAGQAWDREAAAAERDALRASLLIRHCRDNQVAVGECVRLGKCCCDAGKALAAPPAADAKDRGQTYSAEVSNPVRDRGGP